MDRDGGDSTLQTLELGTQEYWIAYPPGVPAPDSDPMPWEGVDTPTVSVSSGGPLAGEIFRMLSPAQRARRPAAIVQNREARLAFTLAGVGATWIERSTAGIARESGAQVRSLTPPVRAPYGLIFERENLSPAATAFVEMARAYREKQADAGYPGGSEDYVSR